MGTRGRAHGTSGDEATLHDLHWWVHVIILSKLCAAPPKCAPSTLGTMTCLRGSSAVTSGPWEGRVGVGVAVRGGRGTWEISADALQFWCEPKTAL